jgi:hypothetical protein
VTLLAKSLSIERRNRGMEELDSEIKLTR